MGFLAAFLAACLTALILGLPAWLISGHVRGLIGYGLASRFRLSGLQVALELACFGLLLFGLWLRSRKRRSG
jgi:hypothetical protein